MTNKLLFHRSRRGENFHHEFCPFGVRDLSSDECYSGGGQNRCPYFVRYHHFLTGEIDFHGVVVYNATYCICKCNKPRIDLPIQLSLF